MKTKTLFAWTVITMTAAILMTIASVDRYDYSIVKIEADKAKQAKVIKAESENEYADAAYKAMIEREQRGDYGEVYEE